MGTSYAGLLVDAAGMYHFKSRFRPRYENRYICVRPSISLGWAAAFVGVLGVARLNPSALAGQLVTRLRKHMRRRSLARPQP